MAELFFQNIVDHCPDVAQRATYNNLQAFYQYLDRAKRYVEHTRFELGWAPLGAVVRLSPPRYVRDSERWRAELGRLLAAPHLSLRMVRGPESDVIRTYADAGLVVLDAAPRSGAEVELRAGKAGQAFRALAVMLAKDDIREALNDAGPVWIELEEPESEGRNDVVEAFFDEDLRDVYEVTPGVRERNDYAAARRIHVHDHDRDRCAILLDRLPETEAICVRPNTYVVECELRAIRALEDQPIAGHRPLIRLFENQVQVSWASLPPRIEPLAWQVLTEENRPGTREQRDFVDRALRTPDFMLLEGPPGSGKTTAIVELVLQLAASNRRVLLCASTHVAVDNVIERLKDKKRKGDAVLVVRIGDEDRVAEGIKGFCLNRMVGTELANARAALQQARGRSQAQEHMLEALRADDGSTTLQQVLLNCAEVVCGTTIGILQHPDIRRRVWSGGTWEPAFDTLILDEASKTPFAEFLVPALLARRWIIVGDRRQLSPYVEEGWIETNVEAAIPDGVVSREDASKALADVFAIGRAGDGALLVASENAELREIYALQLAGLFPEEPIVRLDEDEAPSPLLLSAARAVIGTPAQLAAVEESLPLATRIIRLPTGELLAARRRHDARSHHRLKDEEPWAKAVAWRLVRDYELRLLPELLAEGEDIPQVGTYAREIDALQPCEGTVRSLLRVRDDVDRVRRVALPSILESLQVGFDPARDGHGRRFWDNALALGLPAVAKADRLVSLRYQHRMHPDIASFPHARIYGGALLDTPADMASLRSFECPKYRTRVALLDVRGEETSSPISNEAEARVVIKELGELATWAASAPREPVWSVAVLTFYRGQERRIRDLLREVTGQRGQRRYFTFRNGERPVLAVELCTVDRYQGHEADIVILSFVRTRSPGFLNSPNRLNVAITRARYQLVLIGHAAFLARQRQRAPLCALLAEDMKRRGCIEYRY